MHKDNFSHDSEAYRTYRPEYPKALFDYLKNLPVSKELMWDAGTGNGQIVKGMADGFKSIFATDISASQLSQAPLYDHVHYSVQASEQTNFSSGSINLITIAQAIHWFDFDRFYQEVRRVAANDAVIAVIGYSRPRLQLELDQLLDEFYTQTVGFYWDKERRYIDEGYMTIPFPFNELERPDFSMNYEWRLAHLIGYLSTWSAVKHYKAQTGKDPMTEFKLKLEAIVEAESVLKIEFPLLLRIGMVN